MNKAKLILTLCCAAAAAIALGSRRERQARELQAQGMYQEAITMFEKTFTKTDTSSSAIEGIAQCYMALRNYPLAQVWYEKRIRKTGGYKFLPAYAKVLILNGKFDEARIAIEDGGIFPEAQALLASCDSAQQWLSEKEPDYMVRNVLSLNSVYDDYAAMPYERNYMYFCTNRPDISAKSSGKTDSKAAAAYTRIFEAAPITRKFKGIDTIYNPTILFSDVKAAPKILNSSNTNNGPLAYAKNKMSTLYFSRSSKKKSKPDGAQKQVMAYNLEIYSLHNGLEESSDNAVAAFIHNNAQRYSVTHPCISNDGKTMYFVSDMPGGKGGKDIWYSEADSKGNWGKPANCESINTDGDEVFPTMDNEGTLYFASDGHAGMGGLDIFMAKGSKNKWQPVQNMRAPINSTYDDFYLIKTGDGLRGYFTSNRAGGMGGDDIYSFAPAQEIKQPYLWDIRISDEYSGYEPEITMDKMGRQPLFPPSIFKQDAPPVRVAGSDGDDKKKHAKIKDGIALVCLALDYKTQAVVGGVKMCATHSSTHTTQCEFTAADGTAGFTIAKNAEYKITAFKDNYVMASPPIPLNSATINTNQALPVPLKQIKGEFHDIDKDLKRHKKPKSAVKKGQREYRVHLLAIAKTSKLDRSYFDRIREEFPKMQIQKYTDKRYKRYTFGSFAKLSEAQAYMRKFKELGYGKEKEREICFIAVFVNGKHVDDIYEKSRNKPKK